MKYRAIDPVVATLILIIVAVVAGVTAYSFVTGFIAQTTTQAQSPSTIIIDGAELDDSDNSATIKVRNIGQKSTSISAVYILNASDLSLVDSDLSPTGGSNIDPGSVAEVTADGLNNIQANNWYIVKVVADDGSSATLKVKCKA